MSETPKKQLRLADAFQLQNRKLKTCNEVEVLIDNERKLMACNEVEVLIDNEKKHKQEEAALHTKQGALV